MKKILKQLGIADENPGGFCGDWIGSGEPLEVRTPIDGSPLARVTQVTPEEYDTVAARAHEAFLGWRRIPAPKRGEVVRQLGNALRERKGPLGALVTIEMGKIRAEGEGEVQEMIDICDFAVGLSRQLYGLTMHSERPGHRMYEQWHPLGVVGVISAFNFPVAVWAWNCAIAAACGDATLWKPSSKVPLTAIACTRIAEEVCRANDVDPAIFSLVIGRGGTVGEALLADPRIRLVSATGSCRMGHRVGEVVHKRLGRTILELGGNNAIIVTPNANLDLAVPAILFGAVGTAGQRCTSTRRIIVHDSVADTLVDRLKKAYGQVPIGNPLDGTQYPGGGYVTPCIVEAKNDCAIVQEETFAPILYIIRYGTLDEAVALHNGVPQGLSSAIFTENLLEAEQFLSAAGSDCGIANVNIGTSGAEIGGAFGGEKETGGGRESGSDSWKAYMRRQTNTINYSTELPLAQGIKFGE
jgi:aldehyde dehydrogenase (NAD+)